MLQPGQAIKALKLDVEGFELPVIQGAEQIFQQRRIWFMVIELNLLGRQMGLLRTLAAHGFRISLGNFTGPFVQDGSDEQLQAVAKLREKTGPLNLFCVHRLLFQHKATPYVDTKTYASTQEILSLQ